MAGLALYLVRPTGETSVAEVPPDATVSTLLQAFGLPPFAVLQYSGQPLTDPALPLADAGISAEAQLTLISQRVKYGSLALPRDGDADAQEGESEDKPTHSFNWEYGDLENDDMPWAQEFIPPAGCSALVRAIFRLRQDPPSKDTPEAELAWVRISVRRWRQGPRHAVFTVGDSCGSNDSDASVEPEPCGALDEVWSGPERLVPAVPRGDHAMQVTWDLPGVPVQPGQCYAVLFSHVRGSAAVTFGHTEGQFSEQTELYSRHSSKGRCPVEDMSWGTLGGGDLCFELEFV